MQWKFHYTGHDYAEAEWHKINLYLNRDNQHKHLIFVRLSIPRHMVGLFIGRGNYVKGNGGWELFTSGHHIGWSTPWGKQKFYRVEYSGSSVDPHHGFTIRLGRFGFGGRSPNWLKRRKQRQWEKEMEAFEPPAEYFDAVLEHQDPQEDE